VLTKVFHSSQHLCIGIVSCGQLFCGNMCSAKALQLSVAWDKAGFCRQNYFLFCIDDLITEWRTLSVSFGIYIGSTFFGCLLVCWWHTHTHTHPFNSPFSGTTRVGRYLKQETVSGSGIRWAVCKSAPHSRQITMPAPHHIIWYLAAVLIYSRWWMYV